MCPYVCSSIKESLINGCKRLQGFRKCIRGVTVLFPQVQAAARNTKISTDESLAVGVFKGSLDRSSNDCGIFVPVRAILGLLRDKILTDSSWISIEILSSC